MIYSPTDRLAAEIGIRRLHAKCVDAVWRKDRNAFLNCFANDGEWKVASLHMRGWQEIGDGFDQLLSLNERVLMNFSSPILDFQSAELTGRTYVSEQVKTRSGEAMSSIGIYYERFVEIDGEWCFRWRHFDFCYFGPADLSAPLYAFTERGAPPAMPTSEEVTAGM